MKKLFNLKSIIGLCCILYALVLLYKPEDNPINFNVLDLEKPSTDILEVVKPISKLVTNTADKAKMAVFNQEFGKRILSYNVDAQQVNDVYAAAAACFFQDSMNDKYDGLSEGIIELMKSVVSEDNARLTETQKLQMSKNFLGLSWSLTQE